MTLFRIDSLEPEPCVWTQSDPIVNEMNVWDTSCDESYVIIDGGPAENKMKFCCYCGRPLVGVAFAWEDPGEPEGEKPEPINLMDALRKALPE